MVRCSLRSPARRAAVQTPVAQHALAPLRARRPDTNITRTAVAIEHRQPRPKLPANSLLTGNSVATGSYSPESTGRRREPLQIQAVASAPQLRLRDDRQSDLNKDAPPTVGKIRNVIERRVNRLSQPILRPWTCSRGNVSRRWGLPFAGAVSVGTHSDQRGSSPRKRR
jgi:hypothetical protein